MTPEYWTQRFGAFVTKLDARCETIHGEVMEAHAEIAQLSPLEHAPVAALESAIQARFLGLSNKLDAAFDQFDDELDELEDASDSAVEAAREAARAQRDRAAHHLTLAEHRNKVLGAAAIARRIAELLQQEDSAQHCVQCNTPFDPGAIAETRSMPCASCGARLTVAPKPAARAWFGRGLMSVAEAEALPLWDAAREAEQAYEETSEANALDGYVSATERYHRRVFDRLVADHPSWDAAKADQQVKGRCEQIRSMHRRMG